MILTTISFQGALRLIMAVCLAVIAISYLVAVIKKQPAKQVNSIELLFWGIFICFIGVNITNLIAHPFDPSSYIHVAILLFFIGRLVYLISVRNSK